MRSKEYSPEEESELQNSRILSDAELIKGGARYEPSVEGNPVLKPTNEQKKNIENFSEQKESKEQGAVDVFVLMIEKGDNLGAVRCLHDNHFDINVTNREGITPLIAAIEADNKAMFNYLVTHSGIDLHATDKQGRTPLWHAINNKGTYKYLLQSMGAKR